MQFAPREIEKDLKRRVTNGLKSLRERRERHAVASWRRSIPVEEGFEGRGDVSCASRRCVASNGPGRSGPRWRSIASAEVMKLRQISAGTVPPLILPSDLLSSRPTHTPTTRLPAKPTKSASRFSCVVPVFRRSEQRARRDARCRCLLPRIASRASARGRAPHRARRRGRKNALKPSGACSSGKPRATIG